MSATPQINAFVKIVGNESAIQTGLQVKQPANSAIGENQLVTIDPTTGYGALNDGTVPNQIGAGIGYPGKVTHTDAIAGNSVALLWQGQFRECPASTLSGDGIAATDVGKTWWIANENTPGKLSNSAGSNRSMGGLILGLFNNLPHLLGGVVGWTLGRAAHVLDNSSIRFRTAADGSAGATTAETGTTREPWHFQITGASVNFDASVTGSDTTYATITVTARDLNGANQRTIATGATGATSATANWMGGTSTAFKSQAMTLTATAASLNLLETDIITYAITKASTGTQLPAATVRLVGRVI